MGGHGVAGVMGWGRVAGSGVKLWPRPHREGRDQYNRAVGVDSEDPFAAIYRCLTPPRPWPRPASTLT